MTYLSYFATQQLSWLTNTHGLVINRATLMHGVADHVIFLTTLHDIMFQ
jgi:hypothetical protein